MVNITWRPFLNSDLPFFHELISESSKWRRNELKDTELNEYLRQYEELAGEWRIWEFEGNPSAVSFHLESALSNQKPWMGTVLVKGRERRKGIGSTLINNIAQELKGKGHRALFSGVPIDEYEWSNFLSDCGFEQFKSEENKGETYLIMVRPLD